MTIKIAINGFGRIGRNIMRALYESGFRNDIELVAINDLGDIKTNSHLLKYDSVHGRFSGSVTENGKDLIVNGDKIRVCAERNPADLPWRELGVDVALECTGLFTSRDKATMHLQAGAKKVLISAPAGNDVPTVVFGVNEKTLKPDDHIISNASCTTNCLAPLVKVMHESVGVKHGFMTTVHSYTNDQRLTDSYHQDLRRARAAAVSMIPTKTGAAAAVGLVLPELKGKLDGYAIRVPTINVSIIDFTFEAGREVSVQEINDLMLKASKGNLNGILVYNDEPLVSVDFNGNPASATFDATETRVIDRMVKIVAWYDNEWGFSNRMLDVATAMMGKTKNAKGREYERA